MSRASFVDALRAFDDAARTLQSEWSGTAVDEATESGHYAFQRRPFDEVVSAITAWRKDVEKRAR